MPVAGPHEVVVRVHATTVNRTDCGFLTGEPFFARAFMGFPAPRHRILGGEFAGVVDAVGSEVTQLSVGEWVFGYSEAGLGAQAEYLLLPEDGPVATIPDGWTFGAIAPSTEASHYAVGLVRAARLRGGDAVLVYGATGAIGTAAVQFLAFLGADVTAVCGPEHVDLVRSLGANRVVDRTAADWTDDSRTYRAVLDAVGKSSFAACRRLLNADGTYLSTDLGPKGQNPFLVLATAFSPGRRVSFPIPPRRDQAESAASAGCSRRAGSPPSSTAPTRSTTSSRPTGT